MHITTVAPAYNEARSMATLYEELDAVAGEHGYEMQMIFVDDGSSDGTWQEIEKLAARDARVLGIRLRRNFGKAAALAAGFDAAEGEIVVTLDADLQDNPAELPRLLARLGEGFDVVGGWKRPRNDPWHRVALSRCFNWMVSCLTGVRMHDHNCGFKAIRREVLREIRMYGERHRYVLVLAAARGFRVGEVVVAHRPRRYGRSKYGLRRLVTGFLDLLTVRFITGFGHRPQHVLGSAGLVAFLLGGLGMVYLAVQWCWSRLAAGAEPIHLHETAALYYSLALCLIGAQFLAIGFLGEMITAFTGRDVDAYSVAEHTSPAARQDDLSERSASRVP